jgi:hypothetical protein
MILQVLDEVFYSAGRHHGYHTATPSVGNIFNQLEFIPFRNEKMNPQ